ncbi:MAG: hypothetical protein WBZ36_27420, partial [Candidatus Nitrosopolaris sp.]
LEGRQIFPFTQIGNNFVYPARKLLQKLSFLLFYFLESFDEIPAVRLTHNQCILSNLEKHTKEAHTESLFLLRGVVPQRTVIYCLSGHRIGRIYKCRLFFETLLEAGHRIHICTAIEIGDQH